MCNGRVHRRVAVPVGACAAFLAAHDQPLHLRIIETIGGALAAIPGTACPDFIDPPRSPRHRSVGHGLLPIGAAGFWAAKNLRRWQTWLRTWASHYRQQVAGEQDPWRRFLLIAAEIAFTLAAGAVAGFLAGYASHLVLDATTPAGLPVL
jgi:hypothetical protein